MKRSDLSETSLITIPISAIKPYPRNPREHPEAQIQMLMKSITRFGFNAPLLVTPEYDLIAGHGRLEAAKRLGYSALSAVVLAHLNEADQRAYRVADNAISLKGEWSLELLASEFALIAEHSIDFDPIEIGFETAEFDGLVMAKKQTEKPGEAVALPERDASAICRPGDLWATEDGRYRLFCGDSREEDAYRRLLGDDLSDMVVSDIPFNVKVAGNVCGLGSVQHPEFAMASGEMSDDEFGRFIDTVFRQQIAFSKPGSVHLQFIDWRSVDLMMAVGKQLYDRLLNLCIWVKTNAGMGSLWRSQHELVCAFRAPGGKHHNNVQLGKHGRHRSNVWHYAGVNSFRAGRLDDLGAHPTCKPVDLIADAIMDVSNRNALILDAFLGSGTTLIAAHKVGRRGAGIEIDPHYADVAMARFAKATGLDLIREDGISFNQLRNQQKGG